MIIAKKNGDFLNQESFRLLRATYPDLKQPLLEFDQFQPWQADKKEILIQQGEPTSIVRFMISGLARLFFVDDEGNEQTKFFLGPGFFLVPMHSLFFEKESLAFLPIAKILTPPAFACHKAFLQAAGWLRPACQENPAPRSQTPLLRAAPRVRGGGLAAGSAEGALVF